MDSSTDPEIVTWHNRAATVMRLINDRLKGTTS
jgi:hypothetical protein